MDAVREIASGWISFYWGKTPEEYSRGKTIGDAIMLEWLRFFPKYLTQKR
jgi:hypothetical protein